MQAFAGKCELGLARRVSRDSGPVLFDSRTEYTPPYDRDDTGSSCEVPVINYFAFPDQATLKEWVLRAAKDKKQFFFFEVKKVGQAELKIDVDLGV